MNPNRNAQIAAGSLISRHEVTHLMRAALNVKSYRFARNLASLWLASYPGDLLINALFSQALLQDGREDLALPILKRVCDTDPEFLPAQRLLAHTLGQASDEYATVWSNVVVLGGNGAPSIALPEWSGYLYKARKALKNNEKGQTELSIHQALELEPESPLAAILHLKLAMQEYEWSLQNSLAEQYYQLWPECLFCQLSLAHTLMQAGQEERAVNLLHKAVTKDVAAQVPERMWGVDFVYRSLWPDDFQIMLPFPLPADVAAAMGWNQLPQGSSKGKRGADTIIESGSSRIASNQQANVNQLPARHHMKELSGFQTEIARLAARMKKPHIASADARFPIFVLLTSREGLEAQYGIGHVAEIDKALQQAVKTCRKMRHWDACLIYADDAKSAEVYGIAPADSNAPWALKNFIKDLDEAMRQRGEMIGALLLVGGAQVVPFHNLPNPVDDMDTEVPSDNPYATADENYFIPSWPVGRLPGSSGNNPQPLIDQIHGMIQVREKSYKKTNLFTRWLQNLLHRTRKRLSFGYTAEVWRRASNSVFRPIGKPHTMVISPPVGSKLIGKYQKQASKLAYYNLHGLEDTSEWYGQRDPLETTSGEDYPVALRPQDIVNSGRAPQIVFSEACYGGHILGKRVEDAIVLKFLASGTQAVVGSTCTSYGSITTPLISADLLGKLFWNYLKEGYAAGPALQRAKIELARQMDKRQGYLDGEDQKTLISFVLYGDPLAQAPQFVNGAKSSKRLLPQVGKINIICDKSSSNEAAPLQISQEVMSQVKGVVRQYLPGMAGARIQISAEHTHCNGHNCPTNQIGGGSQLHARRRVVTLSKSIKAGRLSHPYFARITLNEKGKVVKLAVSR